MTDLENIVLVDLHDKENEAAWMDRWEKSYPSYTAVECSVNDTIATWQAQLKNALQAENETKYMVVAYGTGVAAFLAWLYQSDITTQRKIQGAMLVSPNKDSWKDDDAKTLSKGRANFLCSVIESEAASAEQLQWCQDLATQMGAKMLKSPVEGFIASHLHGWQWGMQLMQEMLVDQKN